MLNGKRRNSGFTLVELVIVIILIGVLAGISAAIILQGVKTYSDEKYRSDAHYQARLAMERLAREARLIRSCADIAAPANPSNTLTFTDINGNNIVFTVAGTNLSRNGNLLASGITSAQPFAFLAADGATNTTACPAIWFIQINLESTQGSSVIQMRTRVHPMNF